MGLFDILFGRHAADGSSPDKAIAVSSIEAEYKWIQRNCPGYMPRSQFLQNINGKMHDVLELQNQQGQERTIYFDITQFYGK